MHALQYIFGPVPSRRLGRSLGVDVIPKKTCTLDCVYCELGPTDQRALRRTEYVPVAPIIADVRTALSRPERIDTITFSGSGEPTLNSGLGAMIRSVKQLTRLPVAVITNGTLLYLPEVRSDLQEADIVLPSLDAASEKVFQRINRPHPRLRLESMINGLKLFRKEFRGQLWLEILFVKDLNDGDEELARMKNIIDEIAPDKVQLNTVVRPPSVTDAEPLSPDKLACIREFFGRGCEVIASPGRKSGSTSLHPDAERVLAVLRRRPMTMTDIAWSLDSPLEHVKTVLEQLQEKELIFSYDFQGSRFFEDPQSSKQRDSSLLEENSA